MPKNARNITLEPSISIQSVAIANDRIPLLGDCCFELGAERENRVFIARPSNQLDSNGQPASAHRQRQADCRLSGAVEGMRDTQPVKELCGGRLDLLAEGPDFRRRVG